MKQEDKELLLKNLCARLPYGVKCKIALYRTAFNVLGIVENKVKLDSPVYDEGDDWWEVTEVKPYLRPMSSMTKEERKEWLSLMRKEYREQYPHSAVDTSYYEYFPTIESFDYLNSHHFDYRGLIEKGLALEAPSDMYKIE